MGEVIKMINNVGNSGNKEQDLLENSHLHLTGSTIGLAVLIAFVFAVLESNRPLSDLVEVAKTLQP